MIGSTARATAENLETLEEELKTMMAKELENCGPHQAKMKEEMGGSWWKLCFLKKSSQVWNHF